MATLCPGCFEEEVPSDGEPCPTCGWSGGQDRPPLALPVQTELKGRYTAGRVLGDPGGFGVTYLGHDRLQGERVAIKEYMPREIAGRDTDGVSVTPHSGRGDEEFAYGKEQFLGEAQTLAQFDHANIVSVRDFFEANGTAYLVMEYYKGKTLDAYLEEVPEGRMESAAATEVIVRVLDGLKEVHREGYLHRDVKPENVYLTKEGRPILIDFGAARQAVGERSRSLSVVMTPGYAPYEQYSRKGNQGPHTDVYGAGATLYRMVTGEKPPAATDRVIEDTLQAPQELNSGVSEGLSRAIMGALAMGDQERTSTAEVLQERVQTGTQGSGGTPDLSTKQSSEFSTELGMNPALGEHVELAHVLREHEDGVTSVAFSPSGRLLATGCRDNTARLWSAEGGELVCTLRGHGDKVTSVAFSPDGRLVATGCRDGMARLWLAEPGEHVQTLEGSGGPIQEVTFSPKGKRVVTGNAEGRTELWSAKSGKRAFTLRGHEDWMRSVVFSPNGNLLATAGEHAVRLWSMKTGKVTKTLKEGDWAVSFSPGGDQVVTGSINGTAKLWSVENGEALLSLHDHEAAVTAVDYSPRGEMVATGSADGAVKLWLVRDGSLAHTLDGHGGQVESLAFSSSRQLMATGGQDATAKLWRTT